MLFKNRLLPITLCLPLLLSACQGGSDFGFLEGATETIDPDCSIVLATPSAGSTRMAASSVTGTQFVIVTNDSSCNVVFKLNGSTLSTGGVPSVTLVPADLNVGPNTLIAEVTNSVSSTSATWTVTLNTAPTCSGQVPASTGTSFNYLSNLNLSVNYADANADAVSATWLLDGSAAPTLFTASSTATTKSASFQPTFAQVGSRTITIQLSDGYDTTTCSWSVTVTDANTANVTACNPSGTTAVSPLVLTEGGTTNTAALTVTATGTGVTLQWKMKAPAAGSYSNVTGATASVLNINQSTAAPAAGVYEFTVTATDAYGFTDQCDTPIYVKSNDAPSITGTTSPSTNTSNSQIKYNAASTYTFTGGTGVTDVNGDTIRYSWYVDSQLAYQSPLVDTINTSYSPFISVNGANKLEATYDATAASGGIGSHVIKLTITDGHEETSKQWYINANYFTAQCNDLASGEICTLVGAPGIGDGLDPSNSAHQSRIRIRPRGVSVHAVGCPGAGCAYNLAITDDINHVVWYYNRSASDLDYFGKRIKAGTIRVVLGSGTGTNNNIAPILVSAASKRNPTKIRQPIGVAIRPDATNPSMFVALYGNDRVVKLDNNGITEFFGTLGASTNTASPAYHASAASRVQCNDPYGLDYDSLNDKFYVVCSGDQSVRAITWTDFNDPATFSAPIISAAAGGTTTNGTAGAAGTARTYSPRMLKVDSTTGNVFWTEGCATSARRGGTVRVYVPAGASLTWGAMPVINGGAGGYVSQIIGDTGMATNSCTASATGTAQRNIILNSPVDLFVTSNGLYVTDNNQDAVFYVNKNGTADTTNFGSWLNAGAGAPSQQLTKIAGLSPGSASTSDGSTGPLTYLYEPFGVSVQTEGTTDYLYLSDNYNRRLRKMSLTGNGVISSIAGFGNQRNGPYVSATNGVVAAASNAPDAFLYDPTSLTIDNTAKKLYIGEMFYRRVSVVNLATGEFDHYAGSAATGNYGDDLARTAVSMVYPLGLVHTDVYNQYTYPSGFTNPALGKHLLYMDSSTTNSSGNPCLLRSIFQGGSGASIFGTGTIATDALRTIFGALTGAPVINYGCHGIPADASAPATSTGFYSGTATGVAMPRLAATSGYARSIALGLDTSNNPVTFVLLTEKHCILKVNSSGVTSVVAGKCDGSTADSGATATTIDTTNNHFTNPTSIAVDPLRPTNLFIVDQTNQAISKIKYLNLSASNITHSVPSPSYLFGNSVAAGKMLTIYQSASITPYFGQIAASNTKLCITTGRNDTTNTGENNIQCFLRTDGTQEFICGGDTNLYSNRDGAPLTDLDDLVEADGTTESYGYQEGKACSTTTTLNKGLILLYGPSGIAFDSDGNLYIADKQNHIIRMIKAW